MLQGPSTGSSGSDVQTGKTIRWPETALSDVEEAELKVYTDGACYRNGKVDAQASIGIWFGPEHPLNVSKTLTVGQRQSNNTAEILAAVEAIKQARLTGSKKLCIVSDSDLLVQAWSRSVPFWQNNDWLTAAGKPVKHRREFSLLVEEVAKTPGLVLRMEYVPGHGSCLGNVGADALATSAIRRFVEKKNLEKRLAGKGEPEIEYKKSIFGSERGARGSLSALQRKIVEESCRKVDEPSRLKEAESDQIREVKTSTGGPGEGPRKTKRLIRLVEQGQGLKTDLRNKVKKDSEAERKETHKFKAWQAAKEKALETAKRVESWQ